MNECKNEEKNYFRSQTTHRSPLLHLLRIILLVAFLLITQGIYHIECVESDQNTYNNNLQIPRTDVTINDRTLLVKTFYNSPWNNSGTVQELRMSLPLKLGDNMHIPSNGDIQDAEQQKDSPNGLTIWFFWLLTHFLDSLSNLNFNTSNVEEWQALHKCYYDITNDIKNGQWAVAGIFIKGHEPKFFPVCKPDFGKHHQHSEKKLIQLIDEFLKAQLKDTQTEGCILIYTYNSPCFKRNEKGNDTPCFFLISEKAHEWQTKYNLSTEVGFTKYWGPISRTMFKNFKLKLSSLKHNYLFEEEPVMQTYLNDLIASFVMKYPRLILGSNCPLNCFFINSEAKDQFGKTN